MAAKEFAAKVATLDAESKAVYAEQLAIILAATEPDFDTAAFLAACGV